jgi:peptidyl-dipeptidase Dcp
MKRLTISLLMIMGIISCQERNPLLKEWNTPFGVPPFEEVRAEHYIPAVESAIKVNKAEIEDIIKNPEAPTFENTILAYYDAGKLLSKVYRVFSSEQSINSTDELVEISRYLSPIMSAHSSSIQFNDALFQRIKSVYEARESAGYDDLQMRLVEETYKSFERSGSNHNAEDKAKLEKINARLSELSLKFSQNLLKETGSWTLLIENEADLEGLSKDFILDAAARATKAGHDGKWLVGLDNPSVLPFLTMSSKRDLRIKVMDAYLNRCNNNNEFDNKAIAKEIMELKYQKAQIFGYKTFADYVLEDRMAKTPQAVYDLLDEVWAPTLKVANKELADIKAMAKADGITNIQPADWRYYFAKAKEAKYSMDEEQLKPYFQFENCVEGMFYVANRLFGLKFTPVENIPLPHPEAKCYECTDVDGSSLGVIYMDMFARPGQKRGGAWCSSYRSVEYVDGVKNGGVITIVGNFTRATSDKPALLNVDEVETLFHEFGHALSAFMFDNKYQGLSGFVRDFVELPSQINEHWAFAPEVLNVYAKHYQTGEIIPMELVKKIVDAGNYGNGFAKTELVAAMYLDMDLYMLTEFPENFDILGFESTTLKKRGLISQIPPRYRAPYFQHIFSGGYNVGYYSYLWAEVLDCDAFKAFEETGDIFNQDVAKAYRNEILARGSELDAMDLYVNFRGKKPSADALLEYNGLK